MTSRDFCYWLQGFFEIESADEMDKAKVGQQLSAAKIGVIKRHLALVFKHEIDPSAGDEKHQAELNAIHNATKPHGNEITYRC